MTGTELVTAVQSHLGNRDSGKIGSSDVATAARDSVNKAISSIARRVKRVADLERNATVSVTTAGYEYAEPTTDEDSNTISVRAYLKASVFKVGETVGYPVVKIPLRMRDAYWPLTNSDRSGRPAYYNRFGSNLEVYPYPDDSYTINLRVLIWPTLYTSALLGNDNPLGIEWDDATEAYATAITFGKLQQNDDASWWQGQFEILYRETVEAVRNDPDLELDTNIMGGSSLYSRTIAERSSGSYDSLTFPFELGV